MYNIQVYDKSYGYKFTQSPNEVIGDISYSANTGYGQSPLTMELGIDIDATQYVIGDIVEIMEYNENYKSGRMYFLGVVNNINLIAENNQEKVSIELFGIGDLLNFVIYQSGSRKFTKTVDPSVIITEIIGNFNTTF